MRKVLMIIGAVFLVILAVWIPISIHNQNVREESSKQQAIEAFAATGKGGADVDEVTAKLKREMEEISAESRQKNEKVTPLLEEAKKALEKGDIEEADRLLNEIMKIYDPGGTGK